jgi:hypothetical protein
MLTKKKQAAFKQRGACVINISMTRNNRFKLSCLASVSKQVPHTSVICWIRILCTGTTLEIASDGHCALHISSADDGCIAGPPDDFH